MIVSLAETQRGIVRMINVKTLYKLSLIGWGLLWFSGGWLTLNAILGTPRSYLDAVGIGCAAIGLVIVIKTLGTIKKIDIEIE